MRRESIQLSTFSQRNYLEALESLWEAFQFLAEGFCNLLLKHVKGKERFARVFFWLGMSLSAPLL